MMDMAFCMSQPFDVSNDVIRPDRVGTSKKDNVSFYHLKWITSACNHGPACIFLRQNMRVVVIQLRVMHWARQAIPIRLSGRLILPSVGINRMQSIDDEFETVDWWNCESQCLVESAFSPDPSRSCLVNPELHESVHAGPCGPLLRCKAAHPGFARQPKTAHLFVGPHCRSSSSQLQAERPFIGRI